MNDHFSDEFGEKSFAELLDVYDKGLSENLQVGDKVKGTIISIGKDTVFIDTGTKVDATVEKKELIGEDGTLSYQEGDTIELYAVTVNEQEIRLSHALSGVGGLEMLQEAYNNNVPIEGKVSGTCKGGFHVQVLQRRAFCPVSQMDTTYIETPDNYIGQTLEFLITQLEDNGKNIVVSRRKLLEAEIAEKRSQFLANLTVGQEIEGTVVRLMPYGAFVELSPGTEGMVHISELSWSRLETPEEAVALNQRISVKVIGMEEGETSGRKKISLSVKQLDNDPWESVNVQFKVGEKLEGKVTRIASFGAFVEIAPGIEGLVHISEMSHTRRVLKAEEVVNVGESIQVMIKELDTDRRRISLSIRDTEDDPWSVVNDKFVVGQKIDGTLAKKESFGYFVDLAPGITGLLPKSKIKTADTPGIDKAKIGDTLSLTVIQIDLASRKITLAPAVNKGEEEEDWRKFSGTSDQPMSDLAAKLQQALKSSKG
jgi:small subunit ribosomal protein S1